MRVEEQEKKLVPLRCQFHDDLYKTHFLSQKCKYVLNSYYKKYDG